MQESPFAEESATLPALSEPVVILDRPAHAGNIGAVARAMKNMGLRQLRLIVPRQFPHPEAVNFATGAADLLEEAQLYPTVAAAVADLNFLVATTNRSRGQRHTVLTPRELGERLPVVLREPGVRVGLLFGTERTGLETIDVERADWICTIPTLPESNSINLSHAVMIIAYELMLGRGEGNGLAFDPGRDGPRANGEALARLFTHLEEVLMAISFIKDRQNRHLMGTLKALFHRAALDQREVFILRGICSEITASLARIGKKAIKNGEAEK